MSPSMQIIKLYLVANALIGCYFLNVSFFFFFFFFFPLPKK